MAQGRLSTVSKTVTCHVLHNLVGRWFHGGQSPLVKDRFVYGARSTRTGACGVNMLGHYIAGQYKNPSVTTRLEFFTVLLPFLAQRLVSFSNYTLSCNSNSSNTQGCNSFVNSQLRYTSNRSAGCPFHESICRLPKGNILLNNGYLDSHFDLGMNARSGDSFLYRRTTHCAPLITAGYRSSANFSNLGVPTSYT
jgi:hypothetical protein